MEDFGNFLTTNGLKKKEIASFLGVSNAFVTQLCTGRSKLTVEKLALIKANKAWDSSMLSADKRGYVFKAKNYLGHELKPDISSVVKEVLTPKQDTLHTGYLQRKVEDQEKLIRELYQKIGMLEAKLELASKGDEV